MNWKKAILMVFVNYAVGVPTAWAKKTNQAVYEEPFDQAAGGSSLTRASREGVMFANPAMMPFGQDLFRWLGMQTSVIAARESIEFARALTSGKDTSESGDNIVTKVLEEKTPIHFGVSNALSVITNNFGLGVFARVEPDIYGEEYGAGGLPAVTVSAEIYGGAVSSVAFKPFRWLGLGATAKYLYVAEPDITLGLTDTTRIAELTNDPEALQNAASMGRGMGFDVGALLFLQGHTVDYRLALKVDDAGDTKFTGTQAPFKQTIHVGNAITFHGSEQALHLSLDYRDVQGAYEEKLFKRVYIGAKLLLMSTIGLAAGLYQGIPTVGARFELLFLKCGFTAYGREMGDTVGERQRNLYVGYVSLGF